MVYLFKMVDFPIVKILMFTITPSAAFSALRHGDCPIKNSDSVYGVAHGRVSYANLWDSSQEETEFANRAPPGGVSCGLRTPSNGVAHGGAVIINGCVIYGVLPR